uniref:synaptotagmin-8 n=1 Tax=Callithrix jacchus TaxID=9483 RepID=UPI0023DCFE7E|nr:synaptotagmin-8 [Callithrix jacchus]
MHLQPRPAHQQGRKMGHSPDSPSVSAPAGTTALPLIPHRIAGTPWPNWAVTAGAFASGVLLISGLLCAVCCCCRCHRKKPRDKEAVGLGSAQGTTTTHLVRSGSSPDQSREGSWKSRLQSPGQLSGLSPRDTLLPSKQG